jgi:hypothetical protein
MLRTVWERLKSPVVIIQLLSILGAVVVVLVPGIDSSVDKIVAAVAVIINVFAGLNNPTDRKNF